MSLTDAERRGARWLVLLFVLGTVADVHRAYHPALTPESRPPAVDRSVSAPAPSAPTAFTSDAPLDLNRASVADLDRLPGIGPVLARRIVEHRERHGAFRSVDELLGVPGIGARSLERLRPFVVTTR